MTKITVDVPEDVHKQFRHAVLEKRGTRRGAVEDSIIEALQLWTREMKRTSSKDSAK